MGAHFAVRAGIGIPRSLRPPRAGIGLGYHVVSSRLSKVVRIARLNYSPGFDGFFPQEKRGNPWGYGGEGRDQGSGNREQGIEPNASAKSSIGGLGYIDEKVAQTVSKASEGLNLWLRLVETRTLRAAFSGCFGCGEFN